MILFAFALAAASPPAVEAVANDVVTLGTLDGAALDGPVAFSGDGKRLAGANREGAAVFDADTMKTVRAVPGPCQRLALSLHGDKLACDGRVIDVATGNEDGGSDSDVVARSSDGRVRVRLAGGGPPVLDNGRARVVLHTPSERTKPARDAGEAATERWRMQRAVSLSIDAKHVLVELDQGTSIFRTSDGALVATVARDLVGPRVEGGGVIVVYAPSGLVVFDVATGKERRRIPMSSRDGGGFHGQLAITADGRTVVAVDTSEITIVDVAGGEVLRSLHTRGASAAHVALSPDGKTLAIADYSSPLRRVSTATGQDLGVPGRHGGAVSSAAFSADGKRFVTMAPDGARVWSADGALLRYESAVEGTASMPDAHTVVIVSSGVARLLEDAKGAWTLSGATTSAQRGRGCASRDGKSAWLVSDSAGTLQRVDVLTGAPLATADRVGSSYDVAFDVDDAGRLAMARGRKVSFGAAGAQRDIALAPKPPAVPSGRHVPELLDERVTELHVSGDGAWILVGFSRGRSLVAASTTSDQTVDIEGTSGAFLGRTGSVVVTFGDELRVVRLSDGAVLARAHTNGDARVLAASSDGKRVALATGIQVLLTPVPRP